MSSEWRVKSDGRYYRGIRANPDLCDGLATKYVGYFRRIRESIQVKVSRIPDEAYAFSLTLNYIPITLLAGVTLRSRCIHVLYNEVSNDA